MFVQLISLLAAAMAQTVDGCPLDDRIAKDAAWERACDAAVAAANDPKARSTLLFRRAYVANEHQDYFTARDSLNQALALDSANVPAWQELAYTANALGDYAEGEKAADAKIALGRLDRSVLEERAFSRFFLGNFSGTYQDRDEVVRTNPRDADALLARAVAAMWLGRPDAARLDLESASVSTDDAAIRQRVADAVEALARWTARSSAKDPAAACLAAEKDGFRGEHVIGDCSAAFLAETDPAKRAELLTLRAIAWLTEADDPDAATQDRAIAVALDPGNAMLHSNLGFAYLTNRHSWAAAREFDRSIALAESWTALAGRAAARYNLGDKAGARTDAVRSYAIEPNEAALTVAGDLARDGGDVASAKRYWLGAWHLGNHGDDLAERLRSIGVADPDKEPAPGPITLG